jgi:acyl-CoA thioesterase-1
MLSSIAKLFVWLLVMVASNGLASSQDRSILVVGDSLSAGYGVPLDLGWVTLLQARLVEEGYGYRVVNASISGDTTGGGLRRLPRALDKHRPDIVILELGGNDGLRGLPVAEIRENFEQMIELSRAAGAEVILAGMQMPPNYGARYTDEFSALYPDLAGRFELALIGFFMEDVALDPTKMQADGIHPNEAGQPLLLDNVWSVLVPVLERLEEAATLP